MDDKSILDAINKDRRKRSTKYKYFIGLGIVFFAVVGTGIAYIYTKARPKSTPSLVSIPSTITPTYQFAYLQQVCADDMSKYAAVLQQVKTEDDKIGQLIKDPSWTQNIANIIEAESVLQTNQQVISVVSDSNQRLQACLKNVAIQQDFTPAEIGDINAISSGVPTVAKQSKTIAGTTLPTYTYTPYTFQSNLTDYGLSTQPTVSKTSTNTVNNTPSSTSVTPTCNEQQKSMYTSQYNSSQANLAAQEDSAIAVKETQIGQSGLGISGIGQQQIYQIQQSYQQQNQQLTQAYQQNLASINC